MATIAKTADIGLIGLAVMGENLVLNMESHGFTVAVFNRTTSRGRCVRAGRAKGKKIVGTHSVEELVAALKPPRKIMIMVKAGRRRSGDRRAGPAARAGRHPDRRRQLALPRLDPPHPGIEGQGAAISSAPAFPAARKGHSKGRRSCPGGDPAAWPHVKPIFQAIAAKVDDGTPCCDWVGPEGAGHFVKMVHNGIEYGDMQLICEAYFLLRKSLGLGAGRDS